MSTYPRIEWIWESQLVTRLGLNRDELRHLRQTLLTPGADFQIKKNRVEISAAGLAKLTAHVNAPQPPAAAKSTVHAPGLSAEKNAPAGNGQEGGGPVKEQLVTLRVWRIFPKNRHVIEGYKPETDPALWQNRLRIKVKDSSRYTRFDNTGQPLELECRHLQADFYEHAGPPPRRKGRA